MDLHDLSVRQGDETGFQLMVEELRKTHARRAPSCDGLQRQTCRGRPQIIFVRETLAQNAKNKRFTLG
jgi:hypothetical protein